jgi:hypothetical protein
MGTRKHVYLLLNILTLSPCVRAAPSHNIHKASAAGARQVATSRRVDEHELW